MNVSKTITIDLNRPKKNVIHLMQGDTTHVVDLVILKDGVPFAPEDGLTGVTKSIKYIASDGSGDENVGGVTLVTGKTNEYDVALSHGETNVPGFTEVFVVFTKSGNILHSFPITLDVIKTDADVDPASAGLFLRKSAQATKTSGMTQAVGVDDNGKLWTTPGGGGGGEAVLYVEQTLDASEKAQARKNIGAGTYSKPSGGIPWGDLSNELMTSIGKAENAVRFDSQSLTSVEQAQARTNINAATPPTVVTISVSAAIIAEAQDNTIYEAGELTSLTIQSIATGASFIVRFSSPAGTATVLTMPSGVYMPSGFTVEAYGRCEISVAGTYAAAMFWPFDR